MTRTIGDLEYYSRSVVSSEPWHIDPRCLPIPWRDVALPPKLKIGIMWHDGIVRPTPPVMRALRQTVEKLKAAGHEIMDWSPEDHETGLKLLLRMFVADGGKAVKAALEKTGEPLRPEMAAFALSRELGAFEYWQLHLERQSFQKRYLDRWKKAGIDAILAPVTPFSSVENGKFKHCQFPSVTPRPPF